MILRRVLSDRTNGAHTGRALSSGARTPSAHMHRSRSANRTSRSLFSQAVEQIAIRLLDATESHERMTETPNGAG